MKANRNSDSLYKLYMTITMIAFAIIAFLKFTRVYETINFGKYSFIFAVATVGIILAGYYAINYFSGKASKVYLLFMYSFLSIASFIDCMYFSYNNKLPTIGNINLLWQLKAVEDSIEAIKPMQFLWTVIDLPIVLLYMIFIHKKVYNFLKKKFNKEYSLKFLYVVIVILLASVSIATIFYSWLTDFHLRYLSNELVIYHISDILDNMVDKKTEVDYLKYLNNKEIIKDDKYGILKDRNIVIIQVEALQSFVLDKNYNNQEITPFLNKLKRDNSFYFNNYFYQVGAGNTSDAEFTVNNSLLASNEKSAYVEYHENDYHGLPHIVKENGYKETAVFHAYVPEFWNREVAYVNQGFDKFYSSENFSSEDIIGMGLADEVFLDETVEKIKEMQEPFYSFIVTLSSHHPFFIEEKHTNIKVEEEHKGTLFGDYINSVNYVDRALEKFFEEMKKNGLYENTVFLIYGDHFGIPNYNAESALLVGELIGHNYTYIDMFNVPFIIHAPGINYSEEIDVVGGHVDVLPTLLHLLGLENKDSIMMGSDLFTVEENIVYQQTHVGKGSYVTDDVFYYSSNSGIDIYNIAYDLETGAEIIITNEMVERSNMAKNVLSDARAILENNMAVIK